MIVKQEGSTIWRWIAVVAVVANIFLNYWVNAFPINGQTIGQVSGKHPTLFTPAGYAFSIWGVIYLSFIAYVVYQVLPAQRNKTKYDRLAPPFILTSLLSMAWIVSFSFEKLTLSLLLITGMLVTAVVLLVRAKQDMGPDHFINRTTVPFSLYSGWLSVAIIANASVWLKELGWQGGNWGEIPWTLILIGVTVVIGILISWYLRDLIYPLVIAWANIAIWAARKSDHASIATTALVAAMVLIIWTIGYGWWLFRHKLYKLTS
jgi:hypothetical protein